ncbi:MAG: acylphosphatase [Gammaproteobacteria bacterium]|nr:acylphosphatase [Gammaproteobacteria bacterium]MBT8132966.1 acylphosphatase [Gammaproteobacteria bacterium]NNJ49909.1 acylphosphatase [Gammaproteobacteria bacterium]
MDVCKQVFVSGRVQGVFFRDSTQKMAHQLNLSGGVRNLRDGRVEVNVIGDARSVETLIKWLKIGPKFANVSTIEVIDCPVDSLVYNQKGRFEVWSTK